MNKTKILIWDDKQHEAEKMRDYLEPIIDAHNWEMEIEINYDKYTNFQKYLEKNHGSYQLLILDCIEEGRGNVAEQALKMLGHIGSDIKVIVTTGYQPDLFETLPELYGKHKCRAVLKTLFQSSQHQDRMELIISELLNIKADFSGKTSEIKLHIKETDCILNHQVELIGGQEAIKQLIFEQKELLQCDIKTNEFHLYALNQGLSGAIVFNLGIQDQNGDFTLKFLKLSNIRSSIRDELLKARDEYMELPSNYTISYLNSDPISLNDYYLIIAKLIDESKSIRNKIFTDEIGNESEKIVKELMISCLKELYQKKRSINTSEQTLSSILKVFNKRRISFLETSSEELQILTGIISIVNTIKSLQEESKHLKRNACFYQKDNLKNTLIHGDLHSNNVLINEKGKLFIIDPANMCKDHWSRDICKLTVDIFAYGIDNNSKDYFGVERVNDWQEIGLKMIKNEAIDNNGKNKGVTASINWLTKEKNIKNIFGAFYEPWEFQLSLGVEFLRASFKRDTLPAGKRAACLLIGTQAIKIATETYNSSKI